MQQFLLKIVFVALIGTLTTVKCEKTIVKGEVQTKVMVKGLPESNTKKLITDHIEKALEWALQRIGYQEFSYDSSSIEVFSPMATDDGPWSASVAFVVNDFKTSSIDRIQLLARRYLTSTSYYGASIQNISLAIAAADPRGPKSKVPKPKVTPKPRVGRPKTAKYDDLTFTITAKLSTNIEISGLPACDVTTIVTNFVTTAVSVVRNPPPPRQCSLSTQAMTGLQLREAFDYGNVFQTPSTFVGAIAPLSPTEKAWSADALIFVRLLGNDVSIAKVLPAARYYLEQHPQYASVFQNVTLTLLADILFPSITTTTTATSSASK